MTSEDKLANFRQWLCLVLDLIGAEPNRQVEYLHTVGVGTDEILLQFDDVLYVAHARLGDGSMTQEEYDLLQGLSSLADAVNEGPESIWDETALEEASEWRELRAAARSVNFELQRNWD